MVCLIFFYFFNLNSKLIFYNFSSLATRDSEVKDRLTHEPVKTEVSSFLADYERTMEQLEEYVIDLCKPFENSPN